MSSSGMRGTTSYSAGQRPTNFGKKKGIKTIGSRVTSGDVAARLKASKKPKKGR